MKGRGLLLLEKAIGATTEEGQSTIQQNSMKNNAERSTVAALLIAGSSENREVTKIPVPILAD